MTAQVCRLNGHARREQACRVSCFRYPHWPFREKRDSTLEKSDRIRAARAMRSAQPYPTQTQEFRRKRPTSNMDGFTFAPDLAQKWTSAGSARDSLHSRGEGASHEWSSIV